MVGIIVLFRVTNSFFFQQQKNKILGYSTIRKSTMGYKGQSPWCESTGRMPLVYFDHASVDYAKIADACGGIGMKVTNPVDVLPSLREGLRLVRSGDKHVLLDVRCVRD